MAQDMKKECMEIAQRIANEINAIRNRELYAVDNDCDELYDTEEEAIESAKIIYDVDEETAKEEFVHKANLGDYFNDNLGIEYRVDEQKEYRSCEICVGWGGPNVYVDTKDCSVNVYWGERATAYFSNEAGEEIDEIYSEMYNCY